MKPETFIGTDGKEVTSIHWERDGKIVCMPNLLQKDMCAQKERIAPHMRTGEFAAATCLMCKRAVK